MASILVVGSGGGCAQVENSIGCLMAMAEAGVPVMDAGKVNYRGTSAFALVAAMVAAGWHPAWLAGYLSDHGTADFHAKRWGWPLRLACGGSVYQRDGTHRFLLEGLGGDDAILPAVTVIMTRVKGMDRIEAPASFSRVMASSAIDGIFGPFMVDGEAFIDGGYTDNVPLDPWTVENHQHVFLVLPPEDPNHDRHAKTMIGRLLQGFDAKCSQEVNEAARVYGGGYYRNVTLLRPPPIETSMLAMSPERRVMRHAYEWTLDRLGRA